MSYMALYGVWPKKKTEKILELRNSWGGLMYVWENMAGRYLGLTKSYDYPQGGYMERTEELWPLWKRLDIPEEHSLVFIWGFDRAYLTKKNYARMATAIRKFLVDFPPKPQNVNHWYAIAKFLEDKPNAPAIGIYGTSCGDNVWMVDHDEEEDEFKINWKQFYDFCKEIDSLNPEN